MKAFCQWCGDEFEAHSKSHIYCSIEHRALASKEKKAERYRNNKIRARVGKVRMCSGGCGTQLSIYNEAGICDNCLISPKELKSLIKDLRGLFDG